jgi:outer membrane protein assembly factor BamB
VDSRSKQDFAKTVQSSENIIKIAKFAGAVIAVVILGMTVFYAWKIFFNPLGKIAWKIKFDSPRSAGKILEQNDSQITVKAGGEIFQIAVKDGKILKRFAMKNYNPSAEEKEFVSDGKIISGYGKTLQCHNFSGEVLWEKKFAKQVDSLYPSEKIVIVSLNPSFDDDEIEKGEKPGLKAEITALDSSNGNEIWNKAIDGYLASDKISSSEDICALSETIYTDGKQQSAIKVFDPKNGVEKWQIKIESAINGLLVSGKKLIFTTENKINAVQSDGKKKLWTIPHSGFIDLKNIFFAENCSIIFDSKKIIRIEDADGKIRWEKSFDSYIESKTLSAGHIFLISCQKEEGQKEEQAGEKLPERFEDIKDKNLLREALTAVKKNEKYTSILSRIDISTGNEIWRQRKADGFLLSTEKELIKIYDTAAASSIIMMLSPESGETVITRYAPSDGSVIFEKRDKIGLTQPFVIAGSRLIAFEFIRGESGNSLKNVSGIAAFKIK